MENGNKKVGGGGDSRRKKLNGLRGGKGRKEWRVV